MSQPVGSIYQAVKPLDFPGCIRVSGRGWYGDMVAGALKPELCYRSAPFLPGDQAWSDMQKAPGTIPFLKELFAPCAPCAPCEG